MNETKKVALLIAMNIKDHKQDFDKIEDYLDEIDSLFLSRAIRLDFSSIDFSQREKAIGDIEGLQDVDMAHLLYFGDFTEDVWELTKKLLDLGKESKIHKISPCFSKNSLESADGTQIDFQSWLADKIGHFYYSFANLDDLKLKMFMDLMYAGLGILPELRIDDDSIKSGPTTIAKTENINGFINSEKLQELKQEFREIENRVKFLSKNGSSEELRAARKEINKKLDDIWNYENRILHVIEEYSRVEMEGMKSSRFEEGYLLFREGKIEEAGEILKTQEIMESIEQNKQKYEAGKKLQDLSNNMMEISIQKMNEDIRVLGLKANLLPLQNPYGNVNEELRTIYTYIETQIFELSLDCSPLLDAVNFYYEINDFSAAERIINRIEENIQNAGVNTMEYIRLLCYKSKIMSKRKNFDEAKKYLLEAIQILEKEEETFRIELAEIWGEIAHVSASNNKLEEAIGAVEKSYSYLEFVKRIGGEDQEEDLSIIISETLNQIGYLYTQKAKKEKSFECYLKAEDSLKKSLEIREPLRIKKGGKFELLCSNTLSNMGFLYSTGTNIFQDCISPRETVEEARIAYNKCKNIRQKLYQRDPERYIHEMSQILDRLGNLYSRYYPQKFTEAERYFLEAYNLRMQEYSQTPQDYDRAVALSNTAGSLGNMYSRYGNLEKAEKYLLESESLRCGLMKSNPQAYRASYIRSLQNLVSFYKKKGDFKAELKFLETLVLLLLDETKKTVTPWKISNYIKRLNWLYIQEKKWGDAEKILSQLNSNRFYTTKKGQPMMEKFRKDLETAKAFQKERE